MNILRGTTLFIKIDSVSHDVRLKKEVEAHIQQKLANSNEKLKNQIHGKIGKA